LHKKLRRKADEERTSLNKMMVAMIEAALEVRQEE
jgi:hypothetical protein